MKKHLDGSVAAFARSAMTIGLITWMVGFGSQVFAEDKGDKKAWKKYREAAQQAVKEQRIQEADQLYAQALAEAGKFGPKDDRLLESLSDSGRFLTLTHQSAKAEPVLRQLLEIRLKNLGETHFNTAEAEFLLAEACSSVGKLDEAEQLFQQVRKTVEIKFGPYYPSVGKCLYCLGLIRATQKRYADAEVFYKQALDLMDRPQTAVETRRGNATTAVPRIYHVRYLIDFNEVSWVLLALGAVQQEQGHNTDAEAAFKRLAEIVRSEFSNKDMTLLKVFQKSGDYNLERGNYATAKIAYEQLRQRQETDLGRNNPALTNVLDKLTLVYQQSNLPTLLESTCTRLIEINEQAYGSDSFQITGALTKLADLYFRQGKFAAAEPLYRRSLAIEEKVRGEKNLALAGLVSNLAIIYRKQHDDPQQEIMLKKQLAIYENVLGDKSPVLVKILNDYAELLHRNQRDAEAGKAEARAKEIESVQGK